MAPQKPGSAPESAEAAETLTQSEPEDPANDGEVEDSESVATSDAGTASTFEPKNWVRFTFGPSWSFCLWYQQGARWNIRGNSTAIDAWKALDLSTLYRVTWTADGGWIVTGKSKDNKPIVAYWSVKIGTIAIEGADSWTRRHNSYRKLFDTLQEETAGDMDRLSRANWSVGSGGSWWLKVDQKIIHNKLPQALDLMMEKKEKQGAHTTHVSLGMFGSYVAFWSDGTRTWSMQGYDDLHEHLNSDAELAYVVLSPVENDNYFLVRQDGMTIYTVNSWNDSLDDIHVMTTAYMQSRARSDGTHFERTRSSRQKAARTMIITPETNFIDDTTQHPSIQRKIFEVNVTLPSFLTSWTSMTFAEVRRTTTFKYGTGVAAAAGVAGGITALPAVQRWRNDALKRPDSFSAAVARAMSLRALSRGIARVSPYAFGLVLGGVGKHYYGLYQARRAARNDCT